LNTHAIKNRITVASNIELLAIFAVFVAILFFLFPKEKIEKVVIKESKNYDLSISYLKALSATNPKNDAFKLALLELYLKSGKDEDLVKLLSGLENSTYFKDKRKLNIYLYKLYVKEEDKKGVAKMVNKIAKDFNDYDKETIAMIVDDLIRLNIYSNVFSFSKLYIDKFKPGSDELEKIMPDLYYLANNIKNTKYIGHYLVELMKIDKDKWAEAALYYFQDNKQFAQAIDILNYMLKKEYSIKRNEQLAFLYMNMKQYEKASKEFERLTFVSSDKLKYFKNAVNAIMENNDTKTLYSLIQKNENLFLKSEEGSEYILKL